MVDAQVLYLMFVAGCTMPLNGFASEGAIAKVTTLIILLHADTFSVDALVLQNLQPKPMFFPSECHTFHMLKLALCLWPVSGSHCSL